MFELHPDLFSPLEKSTASLEPIKPPSTPWFSFIHSPLVKVSLSFLIFVIVIAAVGPWLSGHSFDHISFSLKNSPPSWHYWMGTDDLGRDIFTRLCFGARISLFIGLTAALIDLIIGVTWGATSAFIGGLFDRLCMRICDILAGLPKLLVVMILTLMLGSGIMPIILSIALIGWIPMARIVRGEVLAIKQQDYILSGITAGASYPRLLFRYLIPNMISAITVATMMSIPKAMFLEAFLSFLGIGVQAPHASWGTMAHEALSGMLYYPWQLFFPALLMSLTIICFNVMGDVLQTTLKVKQRA